MCCRQSDHVTAHLVPVRHVTSMLTNLTMFSSTPCRRRNVELSLLKLFRSGFDQWSPLSHWCFWVGGEGVAGA